VIAGGTANNLHARRPCHDMCHLIFVMIVCYERDSAIDQSEDKPFPICADNKGLPQGEPFVMLLANWEKTSNGTA
jgi:hypothetical protein